MHTRAGTRNAYLPTMNARAYWNHYVEQHGGPVGVAAKLGIPYSTIAGICNGSRGIGRATAQRMVDADPALDRAVLIWVTADPEASGAPVPVDPDAGRIVPVESA